MKNSPHVFSLFLLITAAIHLLVTPPLWGAETSLPPSSSNPPPAGSSPASGDPPSPQGVNATRSGLPNESISLQPTLLPAMIEGATGSVDESSYGLWFAYGLESMGKGSSIGALVSYADLPSFDQNVFTIGMGSNFSGLTEGLELYAEVYFQFGETTKAVDQSAWDFQMGGEYLLPNNENNIFFGLDFHYIGGDDSAGDPANQSFLSYENTLPLLIIEDQTFGVDLDTNYWTIKGGVGAAFTVGSGSLRNNLSLSLPLGWSQLQGEDAAPAPGTAAENPFDVFDQLGGATLPSFSGSSQTPDSRSIGAGGDQTPVTESPNQGTPSNHEGAPSPACEVEGSGK